jgi:hypothetical protein
MLCAIAGNAAAREINRRQILNITAFLTPWRKCKGIAKSLLR